MVGSLLACGCWQQGQHDISEEGVRTRFRQLQESLNNGCVGIPRLSALGNEINGWISCVPNSKQRTKLALQLSDIILSVDLTNQPYRASFTNGTEYTYSPRERATVLYPEIVNATCWVMRDHGCSSRTIMEFFFKALRKYRDASFSIPLGIKPLPGESHEISSARYNCARGAYACYLEVTRRIRRSLALDRAPIFYVPPLELHDEFKCRLEPFFEFPSKEEFYNYLLPGIKRTGLSPTPSTTKSADTKNEDIEVDI